jgi:hypothetical protein
MKEFRPSRRLTERLQPRGRKAGSMTTPPKRKRHSQRYTSPEFKPYVTALGQLALAWNDLQESLKALFWTLMNPPPKEGDAVNYLPLQIWSSIKSDRAQREMLKTAINHLQIDWNRRTLVVELNWLVDRANDLEDLRNDAIHSPLFSVDKSLYGTWAGSEKIAPAWWLFNPRAKKLSERTNLLSTFRYCRDTAIILADYAQLIDQALINPGHAWPGRPSLPNNPPKKGPQAPPTASKTANPPPRPSQA